MQLCPTIQQKFMVDRWDQHCTDIAIAQWSTPPAPPPLVHNALHTRCRLVRTAEACWQESHGLRWLLVHHLLLHEGDLLLLLLHLVVIGGQALVVPLHLTLRTRRLLLPGQLRPLLLLLGPLLRWPGKAQASTRRGLLLEGPLLGWARRIAAASWAAFSSAALAAASSPDELSTGAEPITAPLRFWAACCSWTAAGAGAARGWEVPASRCFCRAALVAAALAEGDCHQHTARSLQNTWDLQRQHASRAVAG